jgi:hypothetical protein
VVEIKGEVDQKERAQIMSPGVVRRNPNEIMHIPVLRLRILTPSGKLVSVLYKGDTLGDVDIGEQVVIKGLNRGGVIHARSIYSISTDSWVTSPPSFLQRLFGD